MNYQTKIFQRYLHVDEEGDNCKASKSIMGEVVGHQFDLPLEGRWLAVRDHVIDCDVPEQVQQAAHQPDHQDPD